jgi:hypothetical protein
MGVSVLLMGAVSQIDWTTELAEQLDWQWREHLRPRFEGLTDEEYHWERVPGMWGIRPRGTSQAPISASGGEFTAGFAYPEPSPAPVTTIAWRMTHLIVGCFGQRAASHFGGPEVSYETYSYPGTADAALSELDASYARWMDGVRGLSAADLLRPVSPAEGPYAEFPMANLVLHINREALHHGAEIALLRDLYLWRA